MDNIQSIFERAFKFHQDGQLGEAGLEYDKVLSLNPAHFDALNLSSIVLASLGQFQAALDRSNLAASINPKDPSVFNNKESFWMDWGVLLMRFQAMKWPLA